MAKQVVFLFLFCLISRYSCFNANTEKFTSFLNDIGRQILTGLCVTIDGAELFGINCAKEAAIFNPDQNYNSPKQQDEHQYVSVTVDPLGTAVGTVMETYTGKSFYSFMGIRFATAGTFEMPIINEEPWEEDFMGGFDATYQKYKCPQLSLFFRVPTGDEDCLFLNVYTPELDAQDPTRKYPVMMFIYGGGFTFGDGSLYIPSRLMDQDVIVVVIHYRLGTLGFLYSTTTSAPGNMGLMDQITALRWIKKYIQYFNGDEENITIFGESAGGASTSFLQLSPQTSADYNNGDQLLDRVIFQSGSATEIWSSDRNYDRSLILHGQATGCYEESFTPDDIVACMKVLPTFEIVTGWNVVLANISLEDELGLYGIVPVSQHELLNKLDNETLIREYIVLPRDPVDMLESGEFLHVNTMAGSNRDEGTLVVGGAIVSLLIPNDLLNDENFLKYEALPWVVNAAGITDVTGAVAAAFRLAFFPNVEMGNATQMAGGMVDLLGMLVLKAGSWKTIQTIKSVNPENDIFFYSFEFESDDALFDWVFLFFPNMNLDGGVSHADELIYFFALPGLPDDREKETIKKMTTLWANFATYGDPTPDSDSASWVDITSKWLPYSLEQENILLMEDDFVQSVDFVKRWNHNIL